MNTAPSLPIFHSRFHWNSLKLGIALAALPPTTALAIWTLAMVVGLFSFIVGWGGYLAPYLLLLPAVGLITMGIGLWVERRDPRSSQFVMAGVAGAAVSCGLMFWNHQASIAILGAGGSIKGFLRISVSWPLFQLWWSYRWWAWALIIPATSSVGWLLTHAAIIVLGEANSWYRRFRRLRLKCPSCGADLLPVCPGCERSQSNLNPSPAGLFRRPCDSPDTECLCNLPTLAWSAERQRLCHRCDACGLVAHSFVGQLPEYHVHVWTNCERLRTIWNRQPIAVEAVELEADPIHSTSWSSCVIGKSSRKRLVYFYSPSLEVCARNGLHSGRPTDVVVALIALDLRNADSGNSVHVVLPLLDRLDRISNTRKRALSKTPIVAWIEQSSPDQNQTQSELLASRVESLLKSRASQVAVFRGHASSSPDFGLVRHALCKTILHGPAGVINIRS